MVDNNPLTTDGSSGNPNAVESSDANTNISTFDSAFADLLQNQPQGQNNPLNAYKTYNYLFTLALLPKENYNKGNYPPPAQLPNILVRSQGDWRNSKRAVSNDYYIDNLAINLYVSPNKDIGTVTNQSTMSFDIVEPYSVGLFFEDLAAAGQREYPGGSIGSFFLVLAIEFAGYKDDDIPSIDPSLTRYMSIAFTALDMQISAAGATYKCTAMYASNKFTISQYNKTLRDFQISGITVEDFLSKSTKGSLQAAINREIQEAKTDKTQTSSDTVEIKIIDNPNLSGVTNQIARSSLFKNLNSAGAQTQPDLNKVYDKSTGVYKENYNVKEDRVMNIPQNTSIISAIREVILKSDYITNQISNGQYNADANGMINWFIIKTRNEVGEYNPQTNTNNHKWIYEVMPYKVHIDQFLPPNVQPPGYSQMKPNIPKVYEWIYTGKNTEVVNWNLILDANVTTAIPADLGTNTANSISGLVGKADIDQTGASLPNAGASTTEASNQVHRTGNSGLYDTANAGTGARNSGTVSTKMMDQILMTGGNKAYSLDLVIRGDPFWLPNDNNGNLEVSPSNYFQNSDGTANTYAGQVYILTNFRTPIDLDPASGLYKFAASLDTISGIYVVYNLVATFSRGKFTINFTNCGRMRAQLTTSTRGSNFNLGPGSGGGYLAAGATDLLSTALNLFKGGGNVFGTGLSVPNLGGILSGVVDNIGSELGGAVSDITDAVGNIGSTFDE
jgi:hypothetical protein